MRNLLRNPATSSAPTAALQSERKSLVDSTPSLHWDPAGTLAGTMAASETLVASGKLDNRFGGGAPTANATVILIWRSGKFFGVENVHDPSLEMQRSQVM